MYNQWYNNVLKTKMYIYLNILGIQIEYRTNKIYLCSYLVKVS